jgi:Mrp family chromosome partitioning ATPase
MGREAGERRQHLRVPVASKHITLHLAADDGSGRAVSARLFDVSPAAISGIAPLAGVSLGTRVNVELERHWWRFIHRVTVPGVVRRISDDGTRWAVQFSPEDDAQKRRLETYVNRAYKAFDRVLKDGIGTRLAESLRRVALAFGVPNGDGTRVIVVTSAVADEGKGSVAAGLAMVLAQEGHRVLLADTDADSPSIAGIVTRTKGLPDALTSDESEASLKDSAVPIWRNVDLLSIAESPDANAVRPKHELTSLMGRLRGSVYDYAILNAAPLLSSATASWLAAAVDDVFVVARAVVSKERDLIQVRDLLARDKAPFRGIILTDEPDGATRRGRGTIGLSAFTSRFKRKAAPDVRVSWNESPGIGPAAK